MALRMLELIAALAHTCTAQWTKLTPAAAPSARTVAAFAQVRVRALATHAVAGPACSKGRGREIKEETLDNITVDSVGCPL